MGGIEAHGLLMLSANARRHGTEYKHSKFAFAVASIAFTIVHICTELLHLSAQSLIGSPSNLLETALGAVRSDALRSRPLSVQSELAVVDT